MHALALQVSRCGLAMGRRVRPGGIGLVCLGRVLMLGGMCLVLQPGYAANIVIVNSDGPGEGLNDPTPAVPVGGNPGTTIGEQRFVVLQRAAEIWGAQLSSRVSITIQARFDPLSCTASSGTLGSSGPYTFFRDFQGALVPRTYFPVALANAQAGIDLDPGNPDVVSVLNSALGSADCLSSSAWYYGLDGNAPPGSFSLLSVALHEFAHGLGFSTLVDLNTGAKANGFDDTYMRQLEDHSTGLRFPAMTDAERLVAMIDSGDLHWVGSNVVAQSAFLTSGRHPQGHVEIHAPNPTQSGSSISHFSTSLFPNELMEPFANSPFDDRPTAALFQDIGWVPLAYEPRLEIAAFDLAAEECLPANAAIDPGEVVTVQITLRNTGTGVTKNLVATLLTNQYVTPLTGPQSYPYLTGGGAGQTRSFVLTAAGPCGATIPLPLALRDGTNQLGTLSWPVVLGVVPAISQSFSNTTPILIPGAGKSGPALPYPSAVIVSGFTGRVSRVTVSLDRLSHMRSDNLDILLVGPQGQTVMLMSDCGGGVALAETTLTFDDTALSPLPDSGPILSGSFRPANYGPADTLPAPAPAPPYGTSLASFGGVDPNGTWRLFALDDSNPDTGEMAGGWTLHLLSDGDPRCCQNADSIADLQVRADPLPSPLAAGSNLKVRFTITNTGPDTAISVTLTNPPPANATLVSAAPGQGTCLISNNTLSCQLGNLSPNNAISLEITLKSGTSGTLTNRGHVTTRSTDPNPANNVALSTAQINASPVLSTIPSQTLPEDSTAGPIAFRVADLETPPESLVVSARSSRTNLIPNSAILIGGLGTNRTLTFTPARDQSGLATIVLTADDGLATVSSSFLATVQSVNDAPVLATIADQALFAGVAWSLTNHATDVDNAPASLRWRLEKGPPGLSLDPGTGLLNWTPGVDQIETTNEIIVVVTDDGVPSLTDAQSFSAIVLARPVIRSISLSNQIVTVLWEAFPGKAYRLQSKTNFDDPTWADLPGNIIATGPTASQTNALAGKQRFYRVNALP